MSPAPPAQFLPEKCLKALEQNVARKRNPVLAGATVLNSVGCPLLCVVLKIWAEGKREEGTEVMPSLCFSDLQRRCAELTGQIWACARGKA